MLLTRKYHFYAAHRNQDLCDKCRNIHGHQYEVRVEFDLEKKSSITTLFAELDAKVKPIIDEYDHGMLIDANDPLYTYLLKFGETFKFKVFDAPTSVENLVEKLYFEIRHRTGLNVYAVEVDETKSSTIRFTTEDAVKLEQEFKAKLVETAAGYKRLLNPKEVARDIVNDELNKPCNEKAAESIFGRYPENGWKS